MTGLLVPADPAWDDALRRIPHDVYHLPAYCAFVAEQDRGTAAALYATHGDAECLIPLVLRAVPTDFAAGANWRDGTSPYGYASPIFTPGVSEDERRACLDECLATAACHDIVSLFLRLHPLLSDGRSELAARGALVLHGQTVYIDLTRPADQLEREVVSGHRYEIRRLRKSGFTTSFDDWDYLLPFAELYRDTMRRVGAHDAYVFPDAYFVGLQAALADSLHLVVAFAPGGELAAGSLFMDLGGTMQYHLSGTAEPFLRLAPTKLLLQEMADWGRLRGRRVLHLGGGVGAKEDSLFRFKAGFSNLRADFHTCRIVTDQHRYAHLSAAWSDAARGATPSGDFFPNYRQPLPSGA